MTIKEYFRALSILYIALLCGQLLFLFTAFFLNYNGLSEIPRADASLAQALMYVAPLIVIGGLAASFIAVKAKLNAIRQQSGLKEKLEEYKKAMILKYALLEAPSFFAIVCYLLTGHYIFMVLAGLMIVVFLVNKPSQEKAAEDLQLSSEDRTKFSNPESHI